MHNIKMFSIADALKHKLRLRTLRVHKTNKQKNALYSVSVMVIRISLPLSYKYVCILRSKIKTLYTLYFKKNTKKKIPSQY